MIQSADKKAWYKQFWPWFLIIVPLSSMVLSFNMLRLAFDTEDSLVEDDYYKEGRAINLSLNKLEEAKRRNISTSILFTASGVEVTINSGQLEDGAALTLDFFHATQSNKDFSVMLLKDASGRYRADIEQDVQGKWRVSLHPHDQSWKIQQTIGLPQTQAIEFNP